MVFLPWRRDSDKNVMAVAIATRRGTSGDRYRLNVAHELGHLMLKLSEDVDAEKAAFRFGAAFLAPAEELRREVGEKRSLIENRRSPVPQVALWNEHSGDSVSVEGFAILGYYRVLL